MPAILEHLRDRPSRTWSIIITVFGDAVVPRGGVLGVQPLLDILSGMGIGGGAVRTALSRLSGDGWLHGTRVGRNSFYGLTEKGRTAAIAAAARIYGPPHEAWDGRISVLLTDAADRNGARDALEDAGFGTVAPGVWIAPALAAVPAAPGLLRIEAAPDAETGRRLAERAWPLAATAEAYGRFLHAFGPLEQWARDRRTLADLDALVARTLLIHEYRRVVLRDPRLPAALLPPDWPGTRAWRLCGTVYPAMLPASERWLDQHGQGVNGSLPPPSDELRRRFESSSRVTDLA